MLDVADLEAAGLLDGIVDASARQERIDFLQQLLRDGFSLEEVQQASRRDRLALLPIDRVLRSEPARFDAVAIAEQSGLPLEFVRRLWRSLGLAETDDTEVAYSDIDLQAAKTVALFRGVGLGEDALVAITQVVGHGMARLSAAIREVAGEALLQPGDSERALGVRYAEAAQQIAPLLTPLLGYVLAVQLREQLKTDIIEQAELRSGHLDGARHITVCFADLVGFTRLGERVPPGDLSKAGQNLTEMAVEAARPPVRLVKMIGDAAMLVSPEPEPLVRAALQLVDLADRRSDAMLPLHVGVASGYAVPHYGDWLGTPVNLASRLTDIARTASVVATKPVRDALKASFEWSYIGERRFRGVKDSVPLYRARLKTAVR